MPATGCSKKRPGKGASAASKAKSRSAATRGQCKGAVNDKTHKASPHSFALFARLPAELRLCIWEFSHAAVIGDGLVFKITKKGKYDRFIATDDDGQNTAVCTLLSTNCESRQVALTKTLPDEIPHPFGRGTLHTSFARDIFLLCDHTTMTAGWMSPDRPSFYSRVRNIGVALSTLDRPYLLRSLVHGLEVFPALEKLYFVIPESQYSSKELRWCTYTGEGAKLSAAVGFRHVVDKSGRGPSRDPRWFAETDFDPNPRKVPARKREYRQRYCWPDVEARRGESNILWDRLEKMHGLRGWPHAPPTGLFAGRMLRTVHDYQPLGITAWPLVEWGEHGMGRLEKILGWNGNEDDWEDTDHSGDSDDNELRFPDESDKWSDYTP